MFWPKSNRFTYNLTILPSILIIFSKILHSISYVTWITLQLHIPSTQWVSTSYVVFMATNTLKPMMQFVTPLSPLHEMLVSTWDKNNTCTSSNHIQLLSLTNQHYAYQRWHSHFSQRYHCQPNMNKFIP
jgi:hypothetical protein